MFTRTAEIGELARPAVTASWKVLACATLSLAITLATMLTIGNTAATRLFVSQPTVSAQSASPAPAAAVLAAR